LAQFFSRSKNLLNELKPKINGKIREMRGDIAGVRREDVVLEIEQFAPYRADSDESLDSLKEIQSKEGE
jgi:hypothetical protein